ncbi:MAG: DUF3017 domain-containing protein [Frankia sp.]|nr:DUF3017 domain-containing protein [Frankia sp.]
MREFVLLAGLVGVGLGLVLVTQGRWRTGLLGFGVVLVLLAAARLVLPERVVGMLRVRGRVFDTLTLLVLGFAVIGLTLAVPVPEG